jgi:hypothetical protein
MTDATWTALHEQLTAWLESLADGESVVLGEPVVLGEAHGLFRHRAKPLPSRFVRYVRLEHYLGAECVGSTAFGGDWEISPADDERLRALGWRAPDGTNNHEWGAPMYMCDVPRRDAARLARMGVDPLRLLDVAPATVEFRQGS